MQQKLFLKAFPVIEIFALSLTLTYISDMICGCSAVTVKFNPAGRIVTFKNLLYRLRTNASTLRNTNVQAWGLF